MDQQMKVMNDRPPADTGQPFYCCSAAWLQPHSWNKCSHFFTKVKLQKWNLSKRRSMERKKRMLRICFWEHDASFSIWSHLEENWPKKKKGTTRGNKYYISDCSCDKILIRDSLIWYWYWSNTIVRMINLTLCNNSLRHVGGISMISVPDDQYRFWTSIILRQGPYLSLSILF